MIPGSTIQLDTGQLAFVPDTLPPENLEGVFDLEIASLSSKATGAASELSGIGMAAPDSRYLIGPLLERESILSSQIEGTVASPLEVYTYEGGSGGKLSEHEAEIQEVMNHIRALRVGLKTMELGTPITLKLIDRLHGTLLKGTRGGEHAGHIRNKQVWIVPRGLPVSAARFIPPPAEEVPRLLENWRAFIVDDSSELPPLVRCALMHYQFEAIHPYEDGNGRIGRLLITLFLSAVGLLKKPLLYLSAYFERDRSRYYNELKNVSDTGDWRRWIIYFLTGVYEESQNGIVRVNKVLSLREKLRLTLEENREPRTSYRILDELFKTPILYPSRVRKTLDISYSAARKCFTRLSDIGVVEQMEGSSPMRFIAPEIMEAYFGVE